MSPNISLKLALLYGMKYKEEVARFGTHLRILRNEKGLSQQELADLADIDKKTIHRIENGQLNPSLDILIALSKALKIILPEFMTF